MHLAIITELFHPHIGGQENRYTEFCRELSLRGHKIDIFTLKYKADLSPIERINKRVTVYRYAFTPRYIKQNSRDLAGVIRYSIETFFKLLSPSYDTVLFNQWPLFHVLFVEPFVHARVTIVDWCEIWSKGIVNMLQRVVSHFPDGHIAINNSVKWWLNEVFRVPIHKIETIPSAIRINEYRASLYEKVKGKIVFVGRLTKHKRLDALIEAVKTAHKTCPNISLDIIGSGPCFNEIKRMIGREEEEFIRLHGFLDEREKVKHLKKAWLLGLLSEREGFPRVVSEAFASGTPVITSNSPNNHAKYVIHEYRAGIICPNNPAVVARKILHLYRDDNLWMQLAQNSLQASKQFDLKTVTDKLERFINRLIIANGQENPT